MMSSDPGGRGGAGGDAGAGVGDTLLDGASFAASYLSDTILEFRKLRGLAERAMAQIPDDAAFFASPPSGGNSIAVIVKHLGGNLASRWTDVLTTDGEKPWRNRDAEFVLGPGDDRASLDACWKRGWDVLLGALDGLAPGDLGRRITIRGEPHTVVMAAQRALAHAAYHVGQIVLLCRISAGGDWSWLSIPPGESGQYLREMLEKHQS